MKRREVGLIPTLTREVTVYVYESTPAFFKDPFFLRGMSLFKEHVDIVSDPAFQERVRNDKVAQSIKQALVQALTAATSTSARMRLDQVGTIAPGKAADLLVLDANPLQDIRNTRQINSVWIGARRLASAGTN
mgnify:CR=1 FL=1